MLNIIPPNQINLSLIMLLENSKYVEYKNGEYQLTSFGFQYILKDTPSQIQSILLNYIRTAERSGRNIVEILQLILNLALADPKHVSQVFIFISIWVVLQADVSWQWKPKCHS